MSPRRFLLCATREAGHLLPMLSVAQELCRRGHEVVVYGSAESAKYVKASGATMRENPRFEALDIVSRMRRANGASAARLARAPARLAEFTARRTRELNFRREVTALSEDYARHLAELLGRERFDVVLADTFAFGAGLGAELAGVPFATQAVDPTFSLNARGTLSMPPHRALERVPGGLWRRVVNAALPLHGVRRRLGLPAQDFSAELYAGMASRTLHLVPAYEGFMRLPPAPGHVFVGPMTFAPPAPASSADVSVDRSTVLVTGSASGHPRAVATMRRVIEALAKTSLRVVVSVGPIEGLHAVGANMTVVQGFAPHDEMIPKAGVLVTHGGWGAVGTALRSGIPMLVTPAFGPQPMVGERLEELSLARNLPFEAITPEAAERAVAELFTSPIIRERLDATRAQLARMSSPALASDALLALAAN